MEKIDKKKTIKESIASLEEFYFKYEQEGRTREKKLVAIMLKRLKNLLYEQKEKAN